MPFQDMPFNGDGYICQQFLKLKNKFDLNVAVETGSCLYSTTVWLGDNFERVYTVEINPEYAKHGISKIAGKYNILPTIGIDSVQWIKTMLKESIRPDDFCIFFLDAHWEEHCPLLEELDAICEIEMQAPVIAIHDFYTGDEQHGYDSYNGNRFDYDFIKEKISNLEKAFDCKYEYFYNTLTEGAKRGIIYITPKF